MDDILFSSNLLGYVWVITTGFQCSVQKGFAKILRFQSFAERTDNSVQMDCKYDTHNRMSIFHSNFATCWQDYLF